MMLVLPPWITDDVTPVVTPVVIPDRILVRPWSESLSFRRPIGR